MNPSVTHLVLIWAITTLMASLPHSAKANDDWLRLDLTQGTSPADAWRDPTGDWIIAADARPQPDEPNRLTWDEGTGVLLNGRLGKTSNLLSQIEHGDVEAHIEFMVPQGSNSGVYFMGRYEIQILDSWGVENAGAGDCGGIYERWGEQGGYEGIAPRTNAARRPGEWQSFDVIFRAPRFDNQGKKTENARFIKVIHNGVVIHENKEVTGPTRSATYEDEKPLGPLMLQGDHGPVAYRNVWLRMPETDATGAIQSDAIRNYQMGGSVKAFRLLESQMRSADPALRRAMEKGLIKLVGDSTASLDARNQACRLLRLFGSEIMIAPLGAVYLQGGDVSPMIRYALEGLRGETVDRIFRDGLDQLKGDLLLGAIESCRVRRDHRALERLKALAKDSNTDVVRAASIAVATLTGNEKTSATDWPVPAQAADLLRTLTEQQDAALGDLLKGLRDERPLIRQVAAQSVRRLEGISSLLKVTETLPELDPLTQGAVIKSFELMKAQVATPAVLQAATSDHEDVRLTAVQALAVLGGASSVPALARAAGEDGAIGKSAATSLAQIPGKDVDEAILRVMNETADVAVQKACIQAAVDRRVQGAVPALLTAAQNPGNRIDALKALSVLSEADDWQKMVELLYEDWKEDARLAAERTVKALARRMKDGDVKLREAYKAAQDASDEVRAALTRALGEIQNNDTIQTLKEAVKDASDDVRAEAIRVLSEWQNASPLETLKEQATEAPLALQRHLALRGYVAVVLREDSLTPREKLEQYMAAMRLADRPEEQVVVINAVKQLAHIDALRYLAILTQNESTDVAAAASYGFLDCARATATQNPPLVLEILKKTAQRPNGDDFKKQAQELIDGLEKMGDALIAWSVSGPYGSDGATPSAFDEAFAPEKAPQAAEWRWVQLLSQTQLASPLPAGSIDLNHQVFAEHGAAYLRMTITSDNARSAILELGSDDGVKVWLNGELVHANNAARSLRPGEDKVAVELKEGDNTLLLKITQIEGDWGLHARLTDATGQAITGVHCRPSVD